MKPSTIEIVNKTLKKRRANETIFRSFGLVSILLGILSLVFLLTTIVGNGWGAFSQTYINLNLNFDAETLGIDDPLDEEQWDYANYDGVIKSSLRDRFPEVKSRRDKRNLYRIISPGATFQVKDLLSDRSLLGSQLSIWLPADDDIDSFIKGHISRDTPEKERRVKDKIILIIDDLIESGELEKRFNSIFFSSGDSSEPEQAGIYGAMLGSFYTLIITLILSFPIGVAAAIYLEEFAPKNRFTDLIEININNLAAVPSIVFGLLGLAIFLNLFGMPRSIPVVAGIVLAIMTLPTVIISSRAALGAVPPSIREAALGLGASKMQTIFHHVFPSLCLEC